MVEGVIADDAGGAQLDERVTGGGDGPPAHRIGRQLGADIGAVLAVGPQQQGAVFEPQHFGLFGRFLADGVERGAIGGDARLGNLAVDRIVILEAQAPGSAA